MTAAPEQAREVRTTCPYCGVGCGVLAEAADGRRGRRSRATPTIRPISAGCARRARRWRNDRPRRTAASSRDRRRAGELGRGARSRRAALLARPSPSMGRTSVAFYVSGQLLTEDYYVANKLMKGFIGSANIDTNSRLCMASSVAGHRRAFGSDTVPGTYEDLELADLVVLVGSNLAWCHPVLYQRIAAAKEARPDMKIVVIDPRRTMTADIADLHLRHRARMATSRCSSACSPISPRSGAIDQDYIAAHTNGFDEALAAAGALDHRRPSSRADRARRRSARASSIDLFAQTRKGRHRLQPGRQPVRLRHRQGQRHHQLPSGDGPHRPAGHGAVLGHRPAQRHGRARGRRACQHAGRPYGDREPGSIATACSASGTRRDRRQAGPEGRRHVPRGRRRPHQGAVDHGDQSRSSRMPDADAVRGRAARLSLRRRLRRAAATPTRRATPMCCCPPRPGARRTARSPIPSGASRGSAPFCHCPARRGPTGGSSRRWPSAWALPGAFAYDAPGRDLRRACRAVGFRKRWQPRFRYRRVRGSIDADLRGARRRSSGRQPARHGAQETRFFADGGFFTPDRKARFVPVRRRAPMRDRRRFPAHAQHRPRPRPLAHDDAHRQKRRACRSISPSPLPKSIRRTPRELGIADADLVRVSNAARRELLVRALVTRRASGRLDLRADALDRPVRRQGARRRAGRRRSPIPFRPAGIEECRRSRVRTLRRRHAYGFAVLSQQPAASMPTIGLWPRTMAAGGSNLLSQHEPRLDGLVAAQLFGMPSGDRNARLSSTPQSACDRFARFVGETARRGTVPRPRAGRRRRATGRWSSSAEHQPTSASALPCSRAARRRRRPIRGAIVCSCFSVGANQIASAVQRRLPSVEAIGAALQAGTNCGSCRAEIRGIIDASRCRPPNSGHGTPLFI